MATPTARAELKAEDVLDALDDLSEEEFDKFKWFLRLPELLPGFKPLRRRQLKRTKSTDIVDFMMQTYSVQQCLEVTSTILEKINRNDLLKRLHCYENPENKVCPVHKMSLNLMSSDGKTLVCRFCSLSDYKQFIPQSMEYRGFMTEREIQEKIKMREMKIHQMKELMRIRKEAAEKYKAERGQKMETAEEGQKKPNIEDEQETTEKEAEEFIKAQEQEIAELLKRSSEVTQSDSSMKDDPPNETQGEETAQTSSYQEKVKKALPNLKDTVKKLLELERVRQHAVDVTLDPETAHPKLILSGDRKQVKHGNNWKKLPDNPERFTVFANVLGQQSFSSGKFYFEVQVTGKTHWDVGVARESVDRKGEINVCIDDGFWAFVLRDGNQYSTGEDTSVLFPLHPGPEKVGVFVDYDQGLVSFYDADTADLIYSFTDCDFNEKLYPYFSPYLNYGGKNSAPLIICPVGR
ncbi:E3 ubiquitin-protein ligase TRIM21-like [Poecilia formosa]|uniref:E3 ubiquitin-protein ligase TRIM21-like n=1 Tax=Poecilia formosa TaxID=48698 RepID=A0A087X4L9_POEFO|nr:PREDICTED: E3 ubiquitin-protein ligase TRIM21-like [Poecilia formosa]